MGQAGIEVMKCGSGPGADLFRHLPSLLLAGAPLLL